MVKKKSDLEEQLVYLSPNNRSITHVFFIYLANPEINYYNFEKLYKYNEN